MKRYVNFSIIYAIIAMIAGVFFREFTKFNNFFERTTLGVLHTHYFVLGMFFFIILLLIEKNFSFSNKKVDFAIITYNIGLNISGIMMLIRGIIQVLNLDISSVINASISGIAGIGHIIISVSMIMLLIEIKKSVKT